MSTDNPKIKYDRAWRGYNDGESVVVTCSACALKWAALALSEDEARRAGEGHLERAHGIESRQARNNRHKAASRARRAATRR